MTSRSFFGAARITASQVKNLRKSLGITAAEAGTRAGASISSAANTWYRWERDGAVGPTAMVILLMAGDPKAIARHASG